MGTLSAADGGAAAAPRSALLLRHGARRWRSGAVPYLLIAPSVLVLGAVLAYPLASLVLLSFQHYGLRQLFAHQGEWVGLANYEAVLGDRFFWVVVLRTAVFAAVNVTLTFAISLGIALLLERVHRAVRVLLTGALVLVWATPVVVAVDLWQWMFDYEFGVINWLLTRAGAGQFIHHNWFANTLEGFAVITVVVVWGAIPFVAITLYAGLTQVPRDLLEAAEADGADAIRKFWHVTVPVLRPIVVIVVTLSTIWDYQVFIQLWVMLNSRPSADYFLIGIYSFSESFKVAQYGLGATLAVLMVLILFAATSFYVRYYLNRITTLDAA